jgi:hydroxymethylbilane synthase
MSSVLRLGSRGSPLALAQAAEAKARLAAAHPSLAALDAIEIVPIRTSGDRPSQRTLAEEGGKGLFTKELEEALLAGTIDFAVHSLKDMETALRPGLTIACCLPREDPRDALVAKGARRIADLAPGAVVGTASVRRKAQLLHARPDLAIVPLRGNVGTRLAKLDSGDFAATVLAAAGLHRLGRFDEAGAVLIPADEMLPAAGQGIIAIEARIGDTRVMAYLAAIDDAPAAVSARAERALLAALDGTCRTPIAALATPAGDRLALDAMVIRPDGGAIHRAHRDGAASDAAAMGADAGAELRRRAGPDLVL